MSANRKIKEEIISILIEHVRIMYSVIGDMGVYYTTWSENFKSDKKNLEKKKNKMQISEEEADELKVRLIKEFAEAGAQGLGEFVDLILRMDNVINYPLEFVDMLSNIHLEGKIHKEISKRYHKLINNIIEMADNLKSTIKNLRDNPDAVFDNTTTIHELENDTDTLYRQFLEYLYSNEEINMRDLLRIRDSIVLLEQMADRIHDIADVIRVLLYQ